MIRRLSEEFFEEFHRLDQRLSEDETKPKRVIQFTSSRFSEGVTSVALAFATYLAETHGSGKVLALEANLRSPAFCHLLGVAAEPSLAAVLKDGSSLQDAIHEVPGLDFQVIPAGATPLEDSDLLHKSAPQRIKIYLEELRQRFQYILIDSAPAGKMVDSAILSRCADGVVIVVEANVTRSEVLENTIKILRTHRTNILGIVLNKRDLHIPKWLYRFL